MHHLLRLIREAHRRSLWQVIGFYLAGSWVALQVVQTLTASLGLPDWVPSASVALLVVGFPIVTGTAVVQEGGPTREEDEETPPFEPSASEEADAPGGAAVLPASGGSLGRSRSGLERILSWPNALLGGVAAFSLLGLATALYMASRLLGIGPAAPLVAQGVFDERAPIVLAQFESATGDSLLAVTATEALRIDLSQSPVVRLANSDRVQAALVRMGHAPVAPLTRSVARELAVREGIQAVIGGELNRAGGGYMITAQLIAAEGSVLTSHRVSAADSTEIIAAIDQLSRALRKKIGESIKSVRASPPLARVTTTSLEALRKYSQALRAEHVEGERDRAVALLEEAIARDSTFAMAWRKLGVILFNRNARPDLRRRALTKAHELRNRLSEVEKYHAEGAYHLAVTEDLGQAITAYENLLQVDSDNTAALNNLAFIYSGPYYAPARSEPLYRAAADSDPSDVLVRLNLVETQVKLGKLEAARSTLEEAKQIADGSPSPWLLSLEANLAVIDGRHDDAHSALERLLRLHGDAPFSRAWGRVLEASLGALRGRVEEAASRVRASMNRMDDPEASELYLLQAGWLAGLQLHVRRDTTRALALIDSATTGRSTDDLGPQVTLTLVHLYADAGRPEQAREYLGRLRRDSVGGRWALDTIVARGLVALGEGRPRDAVSYFREVEAERPERFIYGWLGEAYDRAGVPDSAVAYLRRYARTPHPEQLISDGHHRPRLLRRLGELEEARGDRTAALKHYRQFVELWRRADPELQPRVREVRERIEVLETAGDLEEGTGISHLDSPQTAPFHAVVLLPAAVKAGST